MTYAKLLPLTRGHPQKHIERKKKKTESPIYLVGSLNLDRKRTPSHPYRHSKTSIQRTTGDTFPRPSTVLRRLHSERTGSVASLSSPLEVQTWGKTAVIGKVYHQSNHYLKLICWNDFSFLIILICFETGSHYKPMASLELTNSCLLLFCLWPILYTMRSCCNIYFNEGKDSKQLKFTQTYTSNKLLKFQGWSVSSKTKFFPACPGWLIRGKSRKSIQEKAQCGQPQRMWRWINPHQMDSVMSVKQILKECA